MKLKFLLYCKPPKTMKGLVTDWEKKNIYTHGNTHTHKHISLLCQMSKTKRNDTLIVRTQLDLGSWFNCHFPIRVQEILVILWNLVILCLEKLLILGLGRGMCKVSWNILKCYKRQKQNPKPPHIDGIVKRVQEPTESFSWSNL